MPVIETTASINAPIERVWEIASNVEEFPAYMPDLKSVKVLERSDDGLRTVTEWVGVVREFGMTVKWTEEDIWDPAARTCTFKMTKGDLSKYDGVWSFREEGGKVVFDSKIEFEYDVPLIGAMIKNLITAKMRQNAQNIQDAIRDKAESAA